MVLPYIIFCRCLDEVSNAVFHSSQLILEVTMIKFIASDPIQGNSYILKGNVQESYKVKQSI